MLHETAKERKERMCRNVVTHWSEKFEFSQKFNSEGMTEACDINVAVKTLGTIYDLLSIE